MRTGPGCGRCARSERRTSGESPRCPSVAAFLLWVVLVGCRDRLVTATGELGSSMRHEPELLAQLRFLLGLALGHLVADHPRAQLERADPVLEPVDGEDLCRAPAPHHHVDGGAGPGDEPEPTSHAALSSARWRAAHSRRASRVSTLRCLRDRRTSPVSARACASSRSVRFLARACATASTNATSASPPATASTIQSCMITDPIARHEGRRPSPRWSSSERQRAYRDLGDRTSSSGAEPLLRQPRQRRMVLIDQRQPFGSAPVLDLLLPRERCPDVLVLLEPDELDR